MSWRWLAACLKEPEWVQDLFFSEDDNEIRLAQCVCAGCPVQYECLVFAMTMRETYGVWGMHSPADRRHLARQVRKVGEIVAVIESFVRIETILDEHVPKLTLRSLPAPQLSCEHFVEDLGFDLAPNGAVRATVAASTQSDQV